MLIKLNDIIFVRVDMNIFKIGIHDMLDNFSNLEKNLIGRIKKNLEFVMGSSF